MGALRLSLLRHGQAQPADARTQDFERLLTVRGERDAAEIAARLLKRRRVPDLMLVSDAERARATAEIVARVCKMDAKRLLGTRELYLATPAATLQILAAHAGGSAHVLICGHNPGLSEVASRFGPRPQPRELPTAGLVSALWQHAEWGSLQPELAESCDADDPQHPLEPG